MKKLCSFVLAALLIGGGLTKVTQASANNKKWHTNRIGIDHKEDLSPVDTKDPTIPGRIVRYDSRINSIVSADAKLEKLADGFLWVEGPVWNRKEKYLLFSDVKANKIYNWEPWKGISTYLSPSGYTGDTPFNYQRAEVPLHSLNGFSHENLEPGAIGEEKKRATVY